MSVNLRSSCTNAKNKLKRGRDICQKQQSTCDSYLEHGNVWEPGHKICCLGSWISWECSSDFHCLQREKQRRQRTANGKQRNIVKWEVMKGYNAIVRIKKLGKRYAFPKPRCNIHVSRSVETYSQEKLRFYFSIVPKIMWRGLSIAVGRCNFPKLFKSSPCPSYH